MASGPEKNMVHEDEIWRQQLKEEVEAAKTWKTNWGFLGERSEAEPRGFSTAVAKYQKPGGGWTVKSIRVADNTEAGVAAATSEQDARTLMTSLTSETKPRAPMQPCASKFGQPLVRDRFSGVESRDAAEGLRAHTMQTLGDACRTDGIDPKVKYSAPVCNSHEYGWRAATKTNTTGANSLEIFGVAEHARMNYRRTLHDPVP